MALFKSYAMFKGNYVPKGIKIILGMTDKSALEKDASKSVEIWPLKSALQLRYVSKNI